MVVAFIFVFFLVLGMSIGITIALAAIYGIYSIGPEFMVMLPSKIFSALNSFVFLAMPFFILAGEIMNVAGMTDRIGAFAKSLVGHWRGGLAQTNTLATILFAGISGSATADAAAFGRTLVPVMVKHGYSRAYSCAITAAGSIVGPTIPPSSIMVLYGSIMSVSIAGLFATGIIPGLMIAGVIMSIVAIGGKRKGLPKDEVKASRRNVFRAFKSAFLAIMMPVIILGGILFGIATPTEAAAIAVAYSLILGLFVYKTIKFSQLPEILARTARINGVVFLVVATASALGWWLGFEQIPQQLGSGLLSISSNPQVIVFLIISLLLMLGMVMDIAAVLIIMGPVLVPILNSIQMNPLHAGIVIVLALNISLMTPPVGACLFVLSSVTGEKIGGILKELWPFILGELAILFLFAYSEKLAVFVPRLLNFN